MTRLFRILAIVAVVALGLSPIASALPRCSAGMASHGMALGDDQRPCCPDLAPADNCQIGCAQLIVAPVPILAGKLPQPPVYLAAEAAVAIDWIAPPDTEPPRFTLRA